MNKKIVSVSGLLAVTALLAFAACHKSSSSSSSGSVSSALGGLSSLASKTGGLSVKGLSPRSACSGNSCPCPNGGSVSWSGAFNPTTPVCPTPYTTPGSGLSGTITETATNCVSGGYTYNGRITMAMPGHQISGQPANGANAFVICSESSPVATSMTGSFGLTITSMTITGNGINLAGCTIGMDSYLSSVASGGGTPTVSGSVAWSVSGGNCGSQSGTSSF